MTMPSIPSFLKRAKGQSKGSTKPRAPRRRKFKCTLKQVATPKAWTGAKCYRIRVGKGWPARFPGGERNVIVKPVKSTKWVYLKEATSPHGYWASVYEKCTDEKSRLCGQPVLQTKKRGIKPQIKVPVAVFERSVIKES